jgi:hypothetical protein
VIPVRAAFLVALCVVVTACSSNSRQAVASEVRELVKVGDSFPKAKAFLALADFDCRNDPSDGPDRTVCSRDRTYYIVAACTQRVTLSTNDKVTIVTAIEVQPPVCAGL